jgi:Amt family ammonium transporter
VISWIILKGVNALVGLRAHESVEEMGLDLAEHNERAYNH